MINNKTYLDNTTLKRHPFQFLISFCLKVIKDNTTLKPSFMIETTQGRFESN